jgi:hypothetical protein
MSARTGHPFHMHSSEGGSAPLPNLPRELERAGKAGARNAAISR